MHICIYAVMYVGLCAAVHLYTHLLYSYGAMSKISQARIHLRTWHMPDSSTELRHMIHIDRGLDNIDSVVASS
jgi:hypothetical protein